MAKPTSAARALFARQPHLRKIFTAARARGPLPVAVAYPCDRDALEAAVTAAREGLILPTLVGPRTLIEAAADRWGTTGGNGGHITFTASNQTLAGNLACDGVSSIVLNVGSGSTWTGEKTGTTANITVNYDTDPTVTPTAAPTAREAFGLRILLAMSE